MEIDVKLDGNVRVLQPEEKHQCEASKHGDWVVYECPKCDYQLWQNQWTGEIKTFNSSIKIAHFGCYTPEELEDFVVSQTDAWKGCVDK